MKVRAIWEFEVDVEDFDPKYVDIPVLAKELTEAELNHMIEHNQLSADEFEFSVVI